MNGLKKFHIFVELGIYFYSDYEIRHLKEGWFNFFLLLFFCHPSTSRGKKKNICFTFLIEQFHSSRSMPSPNMGILQHRVANLECSKKFLQLNICGWGIYIEYSRRSLGQKSSGGYLYHKIISHTHIPSFKNIFFNCDFQKHTFMVSLRNKYKLW